MRLVYYSGRCSKSCAMERISKIVELMKGRTTSLKRNYVAIAGLPIPSMPSCLGSLKLSCIPIPLREGWNLARWTRFFHSHVPREEEPSSSQSFTSNSYSSGPDVKPENGQLTPLAMPSSSILQPRDPIRHTTLPSISIDRG